MKLEVGKSYRTRDGEKVKIRDNGGSSVIWPFDGDNGRAYTNQGRYWSHDATSKYDLISEWIEPAKYKEGDVVEIKLTSQMSDYLNGQVNYKWIFENILSHTPAPEPEFDWKDVKVGMAFKSSITNTITWYLAPRTKDTYVLANIKNPEKWYGEYLGWNPKNTAIRAPEHDIEV